MIDENVAHIRKRIADACARSGRRPEDVTLIAVTKTFGVEAVRNVLASGINDIGENFVQEFVQKHEEIASLNVRWHFIGHLQRNKVKEIVGRVQLIHSVDSLRLAEAIAKRATAIGTMTDILLEVNTSGEDSKYGVTPDETTSLYRAACGLEGVRILGLMTIGPFLPDPEQSRPSFRTLRLLRDSLRTAPSELPVLSMGMSGDFEIAIEEGATLVRIGTALFGKRVYH